jgi:hypothetical protein
MTFKNDVVLLVEETPETGKLHASEILFINRKFGKTIYRLRNNPDWVKKLRHVNLVYDRRDGRLDICRDDRKVSDIFIGDMGINIKVIFKNCSSMNGTLERAVYLDDMENGKSLLEQSLQKILGENHPLQLS